MKKIFLLLAFLATTVLAQAKILILDNQTSCPVSVVIWSDNPACPGTACYKYSWPITIPANTTFGYTGPSDPVITWSPSPCSATGLTFTEVVLTGGPCGWSFDLGTCTGVYSNGPYSCSCSGSGTLTATVTVTATTIRVTITG